MSMVSPKSKSHASYPDAADVSVSSALEDSSQSDAGEPQHSDAALGFESQETLADRGSSPDVAVANVKCQSSSLRHKAAPHPMPSDQSSNAHDQLDKLNSSHLITYPPWPHFDPEAPDWLDDLLDAIKQRGITNFVEYLQSMHAQHRHTFYDAIQERIELAGNKDQVEKLIKPVSLVVGQTFVENLLSRIELHLSERDEGRDNNGGSTASVGGERDEIRIDSSGYKMSLGDKGSGPEERPLHITHGVRTNLDDRHVGSPSADVSTHHSKHVTRPSRKGTPAKARFYAKKIAKRARLDDSISVISLRKRPQVDSNDSDRPQPHTKRRRGIENVIGIDTNGVWRHVSSPETDSGSKPSSQPQSHQMQSSEDRDNHPLRRQSAMPRINITGKSNLDESLVQPLRRDENCIGVSPSGTPELQKYHHDPSWRANRKKR